MGYNDGERRRKAVSQYTTGEIAKLCGITVRAVQYYDARGILTPSFLSEGGRRLYSENDARKCRIICFLREIGFSIDSIGKLFSEDDPGSVIALLLEQQEQVLKEEIGQRKEQLDRLEDLKKGVAAVDSFSVESIGDIAYTVENKKKLSHLHWSLIWMGLPLTILQWAGILLWAWKGIWWVFALWAVAVVPLGVFISRYYLKRTAYICPQCHQVFKPAMKESFWASHTPRTRKLTCVNCGHRGYCVEVWGGDEA